MHLDSWDPRSIKRDELMSCYTLIDLCFKSTEMFFFFFQCSDQFDLQPAPAWTLMVLQYLGESLISLPDGSKRSKISGTVWEDSPHHQCEAGFSGRCDCWWFWNLDGVHFEPSAAAAVQIPDSQSLTVKMLISGSGCAGRLSVRLICW